ncbi:hypothetical protein K505DRAFT_261658, partial [Melanomma pulvis-pyrius CBS 109.77]
FTTNVYNILSPTHLKQMCSAIDDIAPDLTFSPENQRHRHSSESPQHHELRDST